MVACSVARTYGVWWKWKAKQQRVYFLYVEEGVRKQFCNEKGISATGEFENAIELSLGTDSGFVDSHQPFPQGGV